MESRRSETYNSLKNAQQSTTYGEIMYGKYLILIKVNSYCTLEHQSQSEAYVKYNWTKLLRHFAWWNLRKSL